MGRIQQLNGENFYPQTYNGVVYNNDYDVSKATGIPRRIFGYCRNIEGLFSLNDIISSYNNNKEYYSASNVIKRYFENGVEFDGKVYHSVDDIMEEDKFGHGRDLVLKNLYYGRTPKEVLSKLKRFKYPQDYNGKVYNSDEEVAEDFNLTAIAVGARRRLGWSIEEIATKELDGTRKERIKESNIKRGLDKPVTVNGLVITSIEDIARITGDKRNNIRSKLDFGWSVEEIILGSTRLPKAPESRSNISYSSSFKLLGLIWYSSLKDCINRLALGEGVYASASKSDDVDEAIAEGFIRFAKKNNGGYITPDLLVTHKTHELNGESYYCCELNEDLEYMSAKEILMHRLKYIVVDRSKKTFRNNGIYNRLAYAETFYNLFPGTSREKADRDGMSIEEAIWELATNNRRKKGFELDGKKYTYKSDVAEALNMNRGTFYGNMKKRGENIELASKRTYGVTVTTAVWKEGYLVDYVTDSYKTQSDACRKNGVNPRRVTVNRVESGRSFEDELNFYIERNNILWTPILGCRFIAISKLCEFTGLDEARTSYAFRLGKKEKLSFWDSLVKYYFTKTFFERNKDGAVFCNGNLKVKGISFIEDNGVVYYHCSIYNRNDGRRYIRILNFYQIYAMMLAYKGVEVN